MDGPILDEGGHLIRFLTLKEADTLVRKRAQQSDIAANYVKAVGDGRSIDKVTSSPGNERASFFWGNGNHTPIFQNGVGFDNGSGEQGFAIGGEERLSRQNGYLSELAAAAFVCRGGVKRVHLLDGTITGVLLLELFKRDGMGTMVARYTFYYLGLEPRFILLTMLYYCPHHSDVYEGTRDAKVDDLAGIRHIIKPLEEAGILVRRTDEEQTGS
ncbi:hypothetical protein Rs2_51772 [Raphanus sativus]|nr:hypothetical protein Rs2_51772 [Raphanus sativus]